MNPNFPEDLRLLAGRLALEGMSQTDHVQYEWVLSQMNTNHDALKQVLNQEGEHNQEILVKLALAGYWMAVTKSSDDLPFYMVHLMALAFKWGADHQKVKTLLADRKLIVSNQ